jgi:hypothetical protein
MSNEITILLNQQTAIGSFISDKKPGAGYHQKYDNLHTFVINFSNWNGEVKLQGTLELFPGNDSWVDLIDTSGNTMHYFDDYSSESGTYNYDITANTRGNFIWIRAVGTLNSGAITQIQFSH